MSEGNGAAPGRLILRYDAEVDALYLQLREGPAAETVEVEESDYARQDPEGPPGAPGRRRGDSLPDHRPWCIYADLDYSDRECYYRRSLLAPPYDEDFLKVVGAFELPDALGIARGRIVTAFLTPTVKPGETLPWPPRRTPR